MPLPELAVVPVTVPAPRAPEGRSTASRVVDHQLRTPLTLIAGHAELLLERYDELPPEMRWTLLALQRGVRRLTDAVPMICALVDDHDHGNC